MGFGIQNLRGAAAAKGSSVLGELPSSAQSGAHTRCLPLREASSVLSLRAAKSPPSASEEAGPALPEGQLESPL